MTDMLPDNALVKFFVASDKSSAKGQRSAVFAVRARLVSAVVAALAGATTVIIGSMDWCALAAFLAFAVALMAELYLAKSAPEKRWYQARAGAESFKTLSWRFAVGADPFFIHLAHDDVVDLFRSRISDVARQISASVATPAGDASAPTAEMLALRALPFVDRKRVYLAERTGKQRDWYVKKADENEKYARVWRTLLIAAEVVAVILAGCVAFAGWEIDAGGVLAAMIGAGAAWLSFKQHSTLRAAYALTAIELGEQVGALGRTSEENWPEAVADAEEAISREHTMWLASRGEVNERL
ncbi:DUF4231 domain-containing protein [Plantibacter flavus]|uniref:DUF4231 domain-containing protein n=1 Tax=Plantibacter TaxID=190323 RepID=UPI0010C18521|nr:MULTISPECIES: DUF4231 domain-containing protein [Plantibacter]MBD8103955.1 DUF4231 domain-containing protein [Plantibacter sp. CFBP 8775]MBD8467402.1 DUF4231 domain-containing protein [Plantibacter sp. CFBP 8798]TKJ96862.1 DUF4231 domain-containing protein [Plantibacter flavus]